MYSIIQKICEKNNKILKEGLEKVLKGDDISSLTSAIADFTNEMGKDLFTEIVKQIDELVYEDSKRKTLSQLRAFTQNGGDIYAKIIDISTEEKREKKIEELEKRIKRKAKKTIFGTVGAKLPTLTEARGELYYELKKIWYGIAM